MNRTLLSPTATWAANARESVRAFAAPLGSAARTARLAGSSLGLPRALLRGLLLRPAR